MADRLRTSLILGSGTSPVHGRPSGALTVTGRVGLAGGVAGAAGPGTGTGGPRAGGGPTAAPWGALLVLLVLAVPGPRARAWQDGPVPRRQLDLAGTWQLVLDPGDAGLAGDWADALSRGLVPDDAPGQALELAVPGPLEALRSTVHYDGVAWLATGFRTDPATAGALQLLEFTQVNYKVDGWIDGRHVGSHEGGYDPFAWDVTDAVRPGDDQRLVLRVVDPGERPVDGLTLATTPHAKESWYHNFGGVLGPVRLVSLARAEPRIERLVVRQGADGPPVLEATVGWRGPPPGAGGLEAEVRLLPAAGEGAAAGDAGAGEDPGRPATAGDTVLARTTVERAAGDAGPLTLRLPLPGLPRWSPEAPRLAELVVGDAQGGLTDSRRFGRRQVRLDADGFHLNGERRTLRGVLYQPHWPATGGVAPSAEELAAEVAAMKGLGFDLVRTHVRPAPPAFLDACDEQGLLVLAEPAIGWVDDDPGLAERLRHEVDWMAARDHHHPSIIAWCVLNELSGEAYRYGEELALRLAAADPDARPVLEDSGAFFGGQYVPGGADALAPMLDEHEYPPFPLPPDERRRLATRDHPSGPTVVSEYGYGTLVDVLDAARTYRDRVGRWHDEALLFAGQAGGARRALESGEAWTFDGWLVQAAQRQAQAAAAMTEALRSNPALDLLCYTQWQAVSSESSAGLRDVWGDERPAAAALSAALADVLVIVEPARRSVREGEEVAVEVVVVNDSGATLAGTLRLGHSTIRGVVDQRSLAVTCPPGVTRIDDPSLRFATEQERAVVLRAQLDVPGAETLQSRPAVVAVVRRPEAALADDGSDTPRPLTVLPAVDRPALADWAGRSGVAVADALPAEDLWSTVVLIDDPAQLADELPLSGRVALWNHVWRGGGALVLVPSPKSGAFGQLVAGRRGTLRFPSLPVDVAFGSAVGHFMGRVFPTLLDGRRRWRSVDAGRSDTPAAGLPVLADALDGLPERPERRWQAVDSGRGSVTSVHLLDEHDAVVSPEAMLVGEPPEGTRAAMLALDHLGHRVGLPIAHVPYGHGGFTFVGLPLLDPVDGAPDPRRDAWLSALVLETAAECAERVLSGVPRPGLPAPGTEVLPASLPDGEWALLATGLDQLAQAVALEDRASVMDASKTLSPALDAAMDAQRRALTLLASGQRAPAFEVLTAAHAAVWTPGLAALLALEQRVLEGVARTTARGTRDDWDRAFQAVDHWGRGLTRWFDDDADGAYAWLGRAELLVTDDETGEATLTTVQPGATDG